jgi:hypothetical protein
MQQRQLLSVSSWREALKKMRHFTDMFMSWRDEQGVQVAALLVAAIVCQHQGRKAGVLIHLVI